MRRSLAIKNCPIWRVANRMRSASRRRIASPFPLEKTCDAELLDPDFRLPGIVFWHAGRCARPSLSVVDLREAVGYPHDS